MQTTRLVRAAVGLWLLTACRSRQEAYRDSATGEVDTAAPKVIVGAKTETTAHDTTMAGLKEMMTAMEDHLRVLDTATAPTIQAMLPTHTTMASQMISRFNDEMQRMNKAAVPEWKTLVDSLRQDLLRMPEMNTTELKTFMPTHTARLTHLMKLQYANMK